MNKETQCKKIFERMENLRGISAWEAMAELGVMRLAARIHDLHDKGIRTYKLMETSPEGARYARYFLMDEVIRAEERYDTSFEEAANG